MSINIRMPVSISQLVGISANNLLNDPALLDPVSKLRVCEPQALIDTDFEYGAQSTKWETLCLVNNIPTYYIKPGADNPIFITSFFTTQGSQIAVLRVEPDLVITGMPIEIIGLSDSTLDDVYYVRRLLDRFTFQVRLKNPALATGEQITPYTIVNVGAFMTNSYLQINEITSNNTNIYVKTNSDHGLYNNITVSFINSQNIIPKIAEGNTFFFSNLISSNMAFSNTSYGEYTNFNSIQVPNGYLYSQVVPYNWVSANVIYCSNTTLNVGSVANVFETPIGHGLDDLDNYAIYVMSPPYSTIAGGTANLVSNFGGVYWANVISPTRVCLRNNTRYGQANAIVQNRVGTVSTSNEVTFPFMFMKNVCEISNIFSNGMLTFVSNHMCSNYDKVVFSNLGGRTYGTTTCPLLLSNTNLSLRFSSPTNANTYTYSIYNVDSKSVFISNTVGGSPLSFPTVGTVNPLAATLSNTFMIQLNQNFTEHNSIYWPNHGLISNESVTYQGASQALGLTNNTAYFVDVINPNRIRLKTRRDPLEFVEILNAGGTSGPNFSRVVDVKFDNRAHTFSIPNHNIYNNEPLVYHSNGLQNIGGLSNLSSYFAKVIDNNTIRLSPDQREIQLTSMQINAGSNVCNIFYTSGLSENIFNPSDTITITNVPEYPDLQGFYNVLSVDTTSENPYFRINISANSCTTDTTVQVLANAIAYRTNLFYSNTLSGTWHDFKHISNFDGPYKVSNVLNANTIRVDTGTTIFDRKYIVDSSDIFTCNVLNNTFFYPFHSLADGADVYYSNNGSTNLIGFTNNEKLFVVVVDANRFSLSNTYENALNQRFIKPIAINQTGYHLFLSNNVTGSSTIPGSVTSNIEGNTILLTSSDPLAKFTTSLHVGERIDILSPSKSYTVTNVFSDFSFTVTPPIPANTMVTSNSVMVGTNMLIEPSGYIQHRAFDGGVMLTSGTDSYTQLIRQTRTYFRYQSGKGIQMSSGTNFNPPQDSESLSRIDSRTIQFKTTKPHGMKNEIIGRSNVIVSGSVNFVNGKFPVSSVVDDYRFNLNTSNVGTGSFSGTTITISNPSTLSNLSSGFYPVGSNIYINESSTATILSNTLSTISFSSSSTLFGTSGTQNFYVSPVLQNISNGFPKYTIETTTNCVVRVGMFDNQNGLFFEYSNGVMNCVKRTSTQQISGRSLVTYGSSTVSGFGTIFTKQLRSNNIVIRGQTYLINNIISDTSMSILPSYKGTTSNNVIISQTVDFKIPQSQWSLDKCDGTGPSGYNLDTTKMQMIYMDYSWYGAGKVRFGFKNQYGLVFYVHEFVHGNIMNEAYLRSGNLPARYEILNNGFVFYQPYVNHWGTSVIMDGRFDEDKSYLFTGDSDNLIFTNGASTDLIGTNTTSGSTLITNVPTANSFAIRSGALIVSTKADALQPGGRRVLQPNTKIVTAYPNQTNTGYLIQVDKTALRTVTGATLTIPGGLPLSSYTPIPILSIRLSPSVDNGVTGSLGARDIINRMQLTLKSCDISVTHESQVQILINPDVSYINWQKMYSPSLAQIYRHQIGDKIKFGIPVYSFRAAGGSLGTAFSNVARNVSTTSIVLDRLAILSNSILGGDGTFPNGPDILTITISPVDSTIISDRNPYSIACRVSWAESQA